MSPEVLRRERDYDDGHDSQYDHLHPEVIRQATWLPAFLHIHGSFSPRFPDDVRHRRNFVVNSDCDALGQLTPTQWNCCWTDSRQGTWAGDLAAQGFAAELTDAFEVIPVVTGGELIISRLVFTRLVLITAHARKIDANRHMMAHKPV